MSILKPQLGNFPRNGHITRNGIVFDLPMLGVGDLYDYSGKGNHVTLNGPTWVAGDNGPALSFDGSDYCTIPADLWNNHIVPTGEFTIIAYVKNDAYSDGAIVSLFDSGSGFMLWRDVGGSTGYALLARGDSQVVIGTGDLNATLNEWQCVVATVSASSMSTYVDGEIWSTSGGPGVLYTTTTNMGIGSETGDSLARAFTGDMNHISVYNYALSAQEIKSLYDNQWQDWQRDNIALWAAAQGGGIPPTPSIATQYYNKFLQRTA